MKHFFFIITFVSWGCNAQTTIPIYQANMYQSSVYYKDTFNDFDKFVGTWKYTNGNTSLTIVLQKKVQKPTTDYDGTHYDMDCIIGAYKYIENGIEKINTLPQLTQNLENVFSYYISGYTIAGPSSVYCLDCGPDDRVLLLGFTDPDRDIEGYEPEMLFRRADSDGIQKLALDSEAFPEDGTNKALLPNTLNIQFLLENIL